jgi:hypothetical protein
MFQAIFRFHVHVEYSKLSVGYRRVNHASLNDYLTHYLILYYCIVVRKSTLSFAYWEALTAPVGKVYSHSSLWGATREHRRNAQHMDVLGVRDQRQKS